MPPPPGRPLMAGAPPVVWRPVGSTDMSLASLSPPPPPNVSWNQRFPSNQVTGQQPVIQQQYGCQGCQQIQQGLQYVPNEGNLDGCRHGAQDPDLSAKMWVGPAQAPNLVPQHQVVLEQAQGGSLAHGPPYQPFPPPVPRASPEQLLSEIRQALPGYELSRLVAIEATQRVLSKHLSEMAAIDEKMGGLFAERAEMQKICHTEHLRLIQLFMTSNISVPEPTPVVSTVPRIASQSPEVSERTTYKQLRRQLAFALPSKQKELLYEHLRRAAEALQRPISSHLLEAIMPLDNSEILGMIFQRK